MAARTVGPVTGTTTAAAAAVLVVCYVIKAVSGVEVPAEVQGAAATVLVFVAGWLTKGRGGSHAAE